eukprot:CAMPEP_0195519718 /NCGR_PEP_ID=MMETSP0794_2-20130614/15329_1 /TAXON_ID=515487 /ORGANISM="Stephanopyxis turris, Strain CCMP 815" /LENGTH=84 /DNA_ID=CAMNT_0040648921 /DNA_START=226 /DNA_END=480 /DNA_ORIENTATION=-
MSEDSNSRNAPQNDWPTIGPAGPNTATRCETYEAPSGPGQPGWDSMSEFGGANSHERQRCYNKAGKLVYDQPTGKSRQPGGPML